MYLRQFDFLPFIQQLNQNQIQGPNTSQNAQAILDIIMSVSQEEMVSYLIAKYNCADEFSDTDVYSYASSYTGAGRFELNFPAYDPTKTYAPNSGVTQGAIEYLNPSSVGPEAFDPAHWTQVGLQYDLGYYDFPYPRFDYTSYYRPGQRVFWMGSVYQCTRETLLPDHDVLLQAYRYSNVGPPNSFPGSTQFAYGPFQLQPAQWGDATPYSVTGYFQGFTPAAAWSGSTAYGVGDYVTYANAAYPAVSVWQCVSAPNLDNVPGADIVNWLPVVQKAGDNRSQMLVMTMVDIALYHLHTRIAPKNVPELRKLRYDAALSWLKKCAHGEVVPQNLELNQPEFGSRISYGSRIKQINSF